MAYRINLVKWGLSVALISILLFSCTKRFEEYNTNPNNATEEDLQKDNLFLGAFFVKMIQSVFPFGGTGSISTNAYQNVQNLCGDAYGGYNGQTHNWSAAGDGLTYNFDLGWNGSAFSLFYTGVMGNWNMVKQRTEKEYPDLYAVAQIIKIYAAQRTTDMYGPMPYSRAGTGIGSPYDAQKDIYLSFFNELDSAILVLKPYAAQGANPLRLFDDVYSGNYNQWIKFANSLKLKIAMRIAYAEPALARQHAEAAVNDERGVILNNADNAIIRGAEGSARSYNNPLKGLTDDYNEARMSANMESFLTGYKDPRLDKLFKPATNPTDQTNTQPRDPKVYLGIRSGIQISDAQARQYVSYSKLRTDFQIVWMPAAETWFLRAEGALRGWNMKGSVKELYETGIQKSFEQWSAGDATAYLQDEKSLPAPYADQENTANSVGRGAGLSTVTIKWDEAANFETKLERIITQKWIALYPNGQEAWSEFRRTRYPKLFPVMVNNSGGTINTATQIRRIPYPEGEGRTNTENYTKGTTLLGGPDNGGTKLWWDKKP